MIEIEIDDRGFFWWSWSGVIEAWIFDRDRDRPISKRSWSRSWSTKTVIVYKPDKYQSIPKKYMHLTWLSPTGFRRAESRQHSPASWRKRNGQGQRRLAQSTAAVADGSDRVAWADGHPRRGDLCRRSGGEHHLHCPLLPQETSSQPPLHPDGARSRRLLRAAVHQERGAPVQQHPQDGRRPDVPCFPRGSTGLPIPGAEELLHRQPGHRPILGAPGQLQEGDAGPQDPRPELPSGLIEDVLERTYVFPPVLTKTCSE